jgi:hypothetical protein
MPELQSGSGGFPRPGGGVHGEVELAVVQAAELAGGTKILECGAETIIYADGGRMKIRCTLKPSAHTMHFDGAFSKEWQEWVAGLF